MASAIQMPKLSDTMEEGTVRKWLVAEGALVKAGEPLAEIETDKATLEMEAYQSGTLLKVIVAAGTPAKVGAVIGVIGRVGDDWQAIAGSVAAPVAAPAPAVPTAAPVAAPTSPVAAPTAAPAPAAAPAQGPSARVTYEVGAVAGEIPGYTWGMGAGLAQALPAAGDGADGRPIRATPVARKLAAEKGVALASIAGSGPAGRITRADVESAKVPAGGRPSRGPIAAPTRQPLGQMRKAIARAMAQSNAEIPHFYLTLDVDMAAAMRLRAEAKAAEAPLSPNDLVLKAVALAALEFPSVQARFVDESTIELPTTCDLGFATALDDGLITPVVRSAERLTIGELGRQVKELAGRARDRKLKPEEFTGATITVSNLGMFEIEHFYAIVSPGQASIVSVGKVREEAVVVNGQLAVGTRMRLGYSGDHRLVDGAVGARFLQRVKQHLENPVRLLLG